MNYKKIYGRLVAKWVKIQRLGIQESGVRLEKHHIVPKCLGGDNSKKNLVKVPTRVHILLHQLLAFIYPDNSKIIFAANMMMSTRNGSLGNTKIASWLRDKLRETGKSKPMSKELREAKRNSMLGKKLSEEIRKNMSIGQSERYKSLSEKERLLISGENNSHKHTDKSKKMISEKMKINKRSKSVKENTNRFRKISDGLGNIYNSITEASMRLGIPRTTINKYLRKNPEKGFKYVEQKELPTKKILGPNGEIYKSLRDCYIKTKHTPKTIKKWIENNPEMGYTYYDQN